MHPAAFWIHVVQMLLIMLRAHTVALCLSDLIWWHIEDPVIFIQPSHAMLQFLTSFCDKAIYTCECYKIIGLMQKN